MTQQTSVAADMRQTVWRWELSGVAFIVVIGSALHFAFDWAGGWKPLALVAAVNESIWEHLKLAFWPGLLWAVMERWRLRAVSTDFWTVKGLALLVPSVLIVTIFGTYTAILGDNLLVLDIGTFVVAVLAGQLVSAWLLVARIGIRAIKFLGLVVLAIQIGAFATLTYCPPDMALFEDPRSGLRGIPLR
jgi:hypothetical protein